MAGFGQPDKREMLEQRSETALIQMRYALEDARDLRNNNPAAAQTAALIALGEGIEALVAELRLRLPVLE